MTSVTIHEAKTHLSRLLRAVQQGDDVVIRRGQTPVARLVPLAPEPTRRRELGFARGMIRLADDFDAPLNDFSEYER
jgi:prevent-host-death family protein